MPGKPISPKSLTHSSPAEGTYPDHSGRIKALQEELSQAGFDCLLISQSRDVLYYTGTAQPARLLVMPDEYRLCVKSGIEFVLRESPLDPSRIEPLRGLKDVLNLVSSSLGPGSRLGLGLDALTANEYLLIADMVKELRIGDCSPLIRRMRSVKDDWEIRAIRKACRIVEAGHKRALEVLRPGMTELELAAQVEGAQREAGHEGVFLFRQSDFLIGRGPLASGPNLARFSGVVYSVTGLGMSPAMPVGASERVIGNGDLVMIDVPVMSRGYHADMARTYHLGPVPGSTAGMFEDLSQIYYHTLDAIRPGRSGSDLYDTALEKALELGRGDQFLSLGSAGQARLIGHGIGLDVNEPPVVAAWDTTPLCPGAVIAIEIHLTEPDGRVVKLEDMILVTEQGHQILTEFPSELIRI